MSDCQDVVVLGWSHHARRCCNLSNGSVGDSTVVAGVGRTIVFQKRAWGWLEFDDNALTVSLSIVWEEIQRAGGATARIQEDVLVGQLKQCEFERVERMRRRESPTDEVGGQCVFLGAKSQVTKLCRFAMQAQCNNEMDGGGLRFHHRQDICWKRQSHTDGGCDRREECHWWPQ